MSKDFVNFLTYSF